MYKRGQRLSSFKLLGNVFVTMPMWSTNGIIQAIFVTLVIKKFFFLTIW